MQKSTLSSGVNSFNSGSKAHKYIKKNNIGLYTIRYELTTDKPAIRFDEKKSNLK